MQDNTIAGAPTAVAPAAAGIETWTQPPPLVRSIPQRTAATALGVIFVGGLVAQFLFLGQSLGLNVPIWISFVLGAAFLLRPADARIDRWDLWLAPAALFFASFVAIRDDVMLFLFDMLAAGSLTLAAVVALGGNTVTRTGWRNVSRLGAAAVLLFLVGAPYLASGFNAISRALPRGAAASSSARLLRGLVIAIPLLVVFAVLFGAADAVFASYVGRIASFNLGDDIGQRIALAVIAGWLLAGTVVCAWLTHRSEATQVEPPDEPRRTLGAVESLTVLIALCLMFAVFVALQAAYLLGGVDTLRETGMTYSEYARRGFFELIVAAGLAIGVIVVLANVVEVRSRSFRALAAVLAAMTGVVLVSAVVRMALYQAAYGWTELRFYALAAIAWLALGLAATIMLVLADRSSRIPRFIFAAGVLIAVLCHIVGPNGFVTERNVERALNPSLVAEGGRSGLDVDYIEMLGADSIGVLLANFGQLPPDQQARVRVVLSQQAGRLADEAAGGWQGFNLSRHQALKALRAAGY